MEIVFSILALIVGVVVGLVLSKRIKQKEVLNAAQNRANKMQNDARNKATEIERDAKRKADQLVKDSDRLSREAVDRARRQFEREHEHLLSEAKKLESAAREIEKKLFGESKALTEEKAKLEIAVMRADKEADEAKRQSEGAKSSEETYRRKKEEILSQLERIANMTQKEAQEVLMKNIEEEAKLRAAKSLRLIEETTRDEAEKSAKRVISIAIARYSSEYVNERTTSSITLPNDEIKGRLIGREGRNIRAIEAATGCDLIVDDTPETVIVSCFDPVRRHIGKLVLEQLIADGRIHPTRIEEMVEKVTRQTNQSMKEAGERALLDLDIVSMHPELVKVIGQLQHRYSYSQNQYHHVREVGFLCGLMASELGLDVKKARRAGLLHDIGKALTHEIEGSHAMIGADLIAKYGEDKDIVYAVRAHHEDVKPETWLDFLVIGADAISASRPGARQEQMENYVRRLKDLEVIATKYGGVERAFAINAGREIRVMVENNKVSDEQSIVLCQDIAEEIESTMTYPGQIKVTVIRETRSTAFAK